jgi:hypothetical protein
MLTEGIPAIHEAEFRLDFPVRFLAEHKIPDHGTLLKLDDVRLG